MSQMTDQVTLHIMRPLQERIDNLFSEINQSGPSSQDSRRLFHGRGGCYPGLESVCVDYFYPQLLLTLFRPLPEALEVAIVTFLVARAKNSGLKYLWLQRRYQTQAPTEIIKLDDKISATEHSSQVVEGYAYRGPQRYQLQFGGRQNLGFFLDMEPGRQWLEDHAKGARVLNLFSYTCAFSVVALAAGAEHVVNVDMSRSALSAGRENHRLNNLDLKRAHFLKLDILKSWSRIKRPGPYDIIIIDPPSHQPGSFVATKDYPKIWRRINELAAPGANVLACLNAPELDEQFLEEAASEAQCELKMSGRLQNSADFPDVDRAKQLKMLWFQRL